MSSTRKFPRYHFFEKRQEISCSFPRVILLEDVYEELIVREDRSFVDFAVFLHTFQIVRQPIRDTEVDSFVVVEVVTTSSLSAYVVI